MRTLGDERPAPEADWGHVIADDSRPDQRALVHDEERWVPYANAAAHIRPRPELRAEEPKQEASPRPKPLGRPRRKQQPSQVPGSPFQSVPQREASGTVLR